MREIVFDLPRSVRFIIEKMRSHGYRADIVGGCVRDFLIGRAPFDFDITTSATPEQTKQVFSEFRIIETGIKHGTVTLLIDGEPFEITTYRIDGEYKDNRHPDSVSFSDRLEDDLSRRDFTMNAICYSHLDGLTDVFGGIEDINNKVIRAVGDPERRFDEDALRILRAIRFSSTLGFSIEPSTRSAIFKKRELLSNISAERIYVEYKKLLDGIDAYAVLSEYLSVIRVFLPEINSVGFSLELLDGLSAFERNIILFYHNDPKGYSDAMRRLRTDNDTRDQGQASLDLLCRIKEAKKVPSRVSLTEYLRDYGERTTLTAVPLAVRLSMIDKSALELLRELLDSNVCYRISDLAVGGKELSSLGLHGKEIGKTLSRLLDAVIKGEIENEKDSLLSFARNDLNNYKNGRE